MDFICAALSRNKGLRELNLCIVADYVEANCMIGDEGVEKLANSLCKNVSLHWLDISFNHITDGGAKSIGVALKSNATLKSLSLSTDALTCLVGKNLIANNGAEFIWRELISNKSLSTLDLSNTNIDCRLQYDNR
eukprot:TRINITY_DN1981_c0_g2_i1.p2 TRINITY_DN1981_c0_g2~~TRINITY_DN1981_c0_g2_i1.p2  ORF type:complete len:135 (+),score=11.57 TRINITY_DN1981_c0_g2_i1:966-1370(+)